MKIYNRIPTKIIRLQICKSGEETQFLNLIECTQEEVKTFVQKIISEYRVSPFISGKRTSVNIREALGGQNGKSTSISFRGLSTKETFDLITNKINENANR